jgi:hypothetical protein
MPKPKEFKVAPEPATNASVNEVIDIMDKWFWLIEDGKADNHLPNPTGMKVTMEEANQVIDFIDKEITYEVTTHKDYFGITRGIDTPADFNRLEGASRVAFVQQILEAKARLGLERNKKPQHPGYYWV